MSQQKTYRISSYSVLAGIGHGHQDAGSINALVHQGSLLLTSPPYLIRDHSMHNTFIVKPIEPQSDENHAGWHFGAYGKLSQIIEPGTFRISFYAKAVHGSRYLCVYRPCGGGYTYIVEITPEWKQYSLDLTISHSTQGLYINPVEHLGSNWIVASEFLLDNVHIHRRGIDINRPDLNRIQFINPDFESDITDWHSTDPKVGIEWEKEDTYNNSSGALRIKVNVNKYCIEETKNIKLDSFYEVPGAGYAHIKMEHYNGKDVDVSRRVFFLGDKGLWVRDSLTAKNDFQAKIGPAWQVVNHYGVQGVNWVNTCANTIPVPYIYELKYMMQWTNQPEDLLIWFSNADGASMYIDDVTDVFIPSLNNTFRNVHQYRIWQKKEVILAPGEKHDFNSVLMPHKPTYDANSLASKISLIEDKPDEAILELKEDITGYCYLYGINDRGFDQDISAYGIKTDAKQFKIKIGSDGVCEYWLVEATYMKEKGILLFWSPKKPADAHRKGLRNHKKNPDMESGIKNSLR